MSANIYDTIKSYTFELIDERMYVIFGDDEVVVIDPFECNEACEDIRDRFNGACPNGKVYIFLTHSHFDHVSGVNFFKERFDCEVVCSKRCAFIIDNPKNETRKFPFLFMSDKEKFHYVRTHFQFPYLCSATMTFEDQMELNAAGHDFLLKEVGGHSDSSIVIVMDGDKFLFAGDNILGNGNELAFNDADADVYENVCLPFFEKFENADTIVCPGHGDTGLMKHFLELIRSY